MLLLVAVIFFAGPVLLTSWLGRVAGNGYVEVIAEGVLRLAMLVGYIWLIGRMPDVRRVFAYHGAEHRAIHAYEHGRALTAANIREYPNAHARCGTAFLLTVMVISLAIFVLLGTPPIWLRIVERIALIPVIASLAYEVLRLGQRFEGNAAFSLLYRPNIWLQSLTTRDPDDAQIEVAVAALEHVIELESGGHLDEELRDVISDEAISYAAPIPSPRWSGIAARRQRRGGWPAGVSARLAPIAVAALEQVIALESGAGMSTSDARRDQRRSLDLSPSPVVERGGRVRGRTTSRRRRARTSDRAEQAPVCRPATRGVINDKPPPPPPSSEERGGKGVRCVPSHQTPPHLRPGQLLDLLEVARPWRRCGRRRRPAS